MPIILKNLDDGIGAVFVCQGNVTGQEIIQANRGILSYTDKLKKSRYCIIDYSETTQYQVSASEIEIIADQDKEIAKYVGDYIVAIVANKNLQFGFSRMWQSICEADGLKWQTMVFKKRHEAEKWVKEKAKEKFGIRLTMK